MSDPVPEATSMRPTVLLVEDDVLIRLAVAEALREANFVVIEASNAAEALDAVTGGIKPDILFTDVRMPGHLDGLQLAALLESMLPNLYVIIASGHLANTELKFNPHFVPKPYDPESVAKQITAALKG